MEEAEYLCDRVAVMDAGKIITCDTPLALIQSLGESATVRARVGRDLDADELASLPGATEANVVDGQLEIHTEDVPATLTALLQLSERLGVRLDNLATTSATLEDVFLAYTGRSLRE
jgi:ABC-2 type transport system ATP-binding protein